MTILANMSPAQLAEFRPAMDAAGVVDGVARGLARMGRTVGALGCSIEANALVTISGLPQWRPEGYLSWVRWLSGQRVEMRPEWVFATPGFTSTQIRNTWLAAAVAANLDYVIIGPQVNDAAVDTPDVTTGNLDAMITALNAVGTTVVTLATLPGPTTSSRRSAVNHWLADRARKSPKVLFVNAVPDFIDYATGQSKTALFYDQTHPNPTGGRLLGQRVVDLLNTRISPLSSTVEWTTDAYHITDNPSGNVLPNPLLAGTGGTVSSPTTGVVPDLYRTQSSAAGTVTAAFAKVAHPTLTGLSQVRVTLGGTADSSFPYISTTGGLSATPFTAGDVYIGQVCVSWAGLSGISSIELQTRVLDGAGNVVRTYDGTANTSLVLPPDQTEIILRTPRLIIPAGVQSPLFQLSFKSAATGAVAGTVTANRFEWRKLAA